MPLAVLALLVGVLVVDPDGYDEWFHRKEGVIEWATVLVLLPAVAAGGYAIARRALLPGRALRLWTFVLTGGCFYFAGEEISWGQWIWHWETPEFFQVHNRQSETNLHNTSRWLNEKPRLVLELAILGFAVLELVRRLGGRTVRSARLAWLLPPAVCLPTALLVVLVRVPDRLEKFLVGRFEHGPLAQVRLSEPQELFFAWFLMLYALALAARLRIAARLPSPVAVRRAARRHERTLIG